VVGGAVGSVLGRTLGSALGRTLGSALGRAVDTLGLALGGKVGVDVGPGTHTMPMPAPLGIHPGLHVQADDPRGDPELRGQAIHAGDPSRLYSLIKQGPHGAEGDEREKPATHMHAPSTS